MSYGTDYPTGRNFKRHKRDGKPKSTCSYSAIDSELLAGTVQWVAKSGGAIRFGLTRDQGAFAVGIYGEGEPFTEYMHSSEDLTEFLLELCRDYRDDSDDAPKMPVKGSK